MRRRGRRGEMMKGEEKRNREDKPPVSGGFSKEGRDDHKRKRRRRLRLFRLCGTPHLTSQGQRAMEKVRGGG